MPMMLSGSPRHKRHAGVGRGEHLADQFVGRQVGVEGAHLGAVDHDVRHRHLGEFEQSAEHVALGARHPAFAMKDVDCAAQLVVPGHRRLARQRHAAEAQHAAHQDFDGADDRPEHGDEERHRRRDDQRDAVRIGDGDRLRQDFAEHDDQRRHDRGGVDHPALADRRRPARWWRAPRRRWSPAGRRAASR